MDDLFERFGLLGATLMMCILMLLYSILMDFSHQESKRKEKETARNIEFMQNK